MGLTREVGEFVAGVRFDRLPPEAVKTITLGFTDCIAVMVPGWSEPVTQIAARAFGHAPGERALLFALAAHALDYDDTGLLGHPSAILVSAILAEAEEVEADGKAAVAAYAAGYEVWAELIRRDQDQHHAKGWHPTAMFGALAAAAASASLRRLDAAQASQAVAVAASLAGGIVANFGSMTKPLQVGRAAQSGLLATRLVEAGLTSSPDAIEDDLGFLKAVSPKGAVDTKSPAALGQEWALTRHGLNVKLYPVCYAAHRVLDAALDLRQQHQVRPDDVASVAIEIGETQTKMLRVHCPRNALNAKFSGEFAATAALIAGRCGRAEVTDTFVQRPDVQALLPKVRIDPVSERDPDEPAFSPFDRVRFTLREGRELTSEPVFKPRGHFTRPVTTHQLWGKFADCTGDALDDAASRALFDTLQRLPELSTLAEIVPLPVSGRMVNRA
jgi:2-methylcitrate dehydratase PrpD